MRETGKMPEQGVIASAIPPPRVPAAVSELIEAIVTAAGAGNDQHIRTLLQDLARVADLQILMLLRQRLYDGLRETVPAATRRPAASQRHLNRPRAVSTRGPRTAASRRALTITG